ncbi:sterol desaturase family protein [Oligoflexus tunisiensis]|uniref:sterol desaturase family protein n=1 Tax=Oligoflexus tunisiensis TaxID=708132 RepID=UPI000B19E3B7|nr:sterol desaturase family protein [Oligoflexus tunisiensis]
MVSNLVIYAALLIFVTLVMCEIHFTRKQNRTYPWAESLVSVSMMVCMYVVFNLKRSSFSTFYESVHAYRLLTLPISEPLNVIVLFFAFEFVYYWMHRWGHEYRWFWASHSVHHSSFSMSYFTSVRLSLTGFISLNFLFFFPLYLIGFSPQSVALMYSANLVYQGWVHTDTIPRLHPWFEYVFNTPSHHRVHHATNQEYLDKNYGGVLIVFDRWFGTFKEEQSDIVIQYGLAGKQRSLNPFRLFFQEWIAIIGDVVKAKNWTERWHFAFGRTGWKPGSEVANRMGIHEEKSDVAS